MYLLAFLIFIAFASPTNQEFVQCKSHIWRWKLEFAVNSSTRVETVAGTNLTIACGAVCQLSKRQECGGATVQWFRVPKWNLSKAEALPYAFWSSGAITYEPYMGAGVPSLYGLRHRCRKESRVCGVENKLMIKYVQYNYDDRYYYVCQVIQNSGKDNVSNEIAESVYDLKIQQCPKINKYRYEGNPCHYGYCTMRNLVKPKETTTPTPAIPLHYFENITTVHCKCLPGYTGTYCDKKKDNFLTPWFWMILSWLPVAIGILVLLILVCVLSNRRTEVIFKDAEKLSPFVKVAVPLSMKGGGMGPGRGGPIVVKRAMLPPLPTGKSLKHDQASEREKLVKSKCSKLK